MADAVHLSRFTPSRVSPDLLERILVQRSARIDDAVERLAVSALTKNKHYLLYVGPRGSGKTHFVTLVEHRLRQRAEIQDRLRIARLNEDETTTSFWKLLNRVHEALSKANPDDFPSADRDRLNGLPRAEAAEGLTKAILTSLGQRTLLIVIEDLDDVFEGIGAEGQRRFRSFLQESGEVAMLATTQKLFSGVSDRNEPFFGFFQVEQLAPLTPEEATELLAKLAEMRGDLPLVEMLRTPSGLSRVMAVHHLTGGNPRLFIILSEFINRDSLDDLIGPLEKLIDDLTPYYQARLQSLSPQQREIVEYLSQRDRPEPVKQIAADLHVSEQTVSKQLGVLRNRGYLIGEEVGRETLHQLAEPLMQICLSVKQHGVATISILAGILKHWYSHMELVVRYVNQDLSRPQTCNILREAIVGKLGLPVDTLDAVLRPAMLQVVFDLVSKQLDSADWPDFWIDLNTAFQKGGESALRDIWAAILKSVGQESPVYRNMSTLATFVLATIVSLKTKSTDLPSVMAWKSLLEHSAQNIPALGVAARIFAAFISAENGDGSSEMARLNIMERRLLTSITETRRKIWESHQQ